MSDEDTSLRDAHNEGEKFEASEPDFFEDVIDGIVQDFSLSKEEQEQYDAGRKNVRNQRENK
mgnify:CR=1 FL=1